MRFYIHKNCVLLYCHVWCRPLKCCRIWGLQVSCVGVCNLAVCCCVTVSAFTDIAVVRPETYTVTHSTRLDSYWNLQESSMILKIRDNHTFSISKHVYQLSGHKVQQESMEIRLEYKIWGSYSSATTECDTHWMSVTGWLLERRIKHVTSWGPNRGQVQLNYTTSGVPRGEALVRYHCSKCACTEWG
jgi:hypothetical protein